tara:strand:- start:715 stop:858 length:144 start_codon:yes stop_codon:yes gene_type:complete
VQNGGGKKNDAALNKELAKLSQAFTAKMSGNKKATAVFVGRTQSMSG